MIKQLFLFYLLLFYIASLVATNSPKDEETKLLNSSLLKSVMELNVMIQQFKEIKNSNIQLELNRNGFSSFSQSVQLNKMNGLKKIFFQRFLTSLGDRFGIPANFAEFFKSSCKKILNSENDEWKWFNFIFSADKESCKYITILGHYDKTAEKADLIIGEITAKFKLAANLLIIEERTSSKGGAYVDSNIKIEEKPNTINDEDIKASMLFFKIICTKAIANFIGISVDLPDISELQNLVFLIQKI